jgi:hypothetical protein
VLHKAQSAVLQQIKNARRLALMEEKAAALDLQRARLTHQTLIERRQIGKKFSMLYAIQLHG